MNLHTDQYVSVTADLVRAAMKAGKSLANMGDIMYRLGPEIRAYKRARRKHLRRLRRKVQS